MNKELGSDNLPFPYTMDALIWAKEFCKINKDSDLDTMIGWFANSIMVGYDTAKKRVNNEQ